MRTAHHARRIADAMAAMKLARQMTERERWPRERLRRYQQQRLEELVNHARRHSAYYAARLPSGPGRLEELPTIDKARMMEHFDEIVCDPRLRRDDLLRWLERLKRDEIYLGRYRAMTTSGSSGRKGLFIYDRSEWQELLALWFRIGAITGTTPRLPRRMRFAAVQGAGPAHMSRQFAASASLGIHRIAGLPVTLPLEQIVARLNRFEPEVMNTYPSVAMRLAQEALAGRLRISLQTLTTSSEMRTTEMTERLSQAFGVQPFNVYATTEGLVGVDCDRHDGVHLFEDLALVENVDANGCPVDPGEAGSKLLVTSLVRRVQPIIRLELPDVLVLDSEPCSCGRRLIRARSIEGRSDDVLWLGGADGRAVRVDPLQFGLLTRDPDLNEFQVVQRGERVRILVVARPAAAPAEVERRLGQAVRHRLAELGVANPQVEVVRRDELERSAGGKLQLVVADNTGR